ncbi:MAG: dihydrodipicolinate synthase family protein [Anaerolineales bacterium]|nr:dihydrodipicolinate synthase family protein [Anaerolineales bacterium]
MSHPHRLAGVYAAAITPTRPDFSPELAVVAPFLEFLAGRGCHGALLMGTTGEGPSFSPRERLDVLRAALPIRANHPGFRLLLGTGTPSLEETIALTRAAFELGVDGVVVLPPYYYKKPSDAGLFAWFSQVLEHAVPAGGVLLGYHIPHLTGVPFSLDLLERLKIAFPDKFCGLKDSSGDANHGRALGERFGEALVVFTGNDRLLSQALSHGAAGCITAMGNLLSPYLRRVWEADQCGEADETTQATLDAARSAFDSYPPAPALVKALLALKGYFPAWSVRPPLLPIPAEQIQAALAELTAVADV